jgi:hypothetical protein
MEGCRELGGLAEVCDGGVGVGCCRVWRKLGILTTLRWIVFMVAEGDSDLVI